MVNAMYSYYTTTHAGRTIHIIKAQADSNHEVCLSVMAERYDSADPLKIASDFSDGYLESNEFTKVGAINGGIFNNIFANGIEVAFWAINENDDASLDGVMGIAHDGNASNLPIIATQSELKGSIGSYRGAITGAFGLLRDGSVNQGATNLQGSYGSKSGRSIIGKDGSGAIYLIATPGVTGSTGLTGAECLSLVQNLGLTDAVALDGGGSVSLIYEGSWIISTTRQIKNVIGLYVKQKSTGGGTGGGETPAVIRVRDAGYLPITDDEIDHKIFDSSGLLHIESIYVMENGILVPVSEVRKE